MRPHSFLRVPQWVSLSWTVAACTAVVVALAAAPAANESVRLAIPDRANAFPALATIGDFGAVAWAATPPGGGADVFVAISRDAGRTFDTPVRVNHTVGEAWLGGELPPRLALAPAASGDPA